MQDGLKALRGVEVGQEVAAWNPATNGARLAKVIGKSSRIAPGVVHLTLADPGGHQETVTVTPNHPYLMAANDNAAGPRLVMLEPAVHWTAAGYLKPGDQIASATGTPLSVVSSQVDPTPLRAYDLEVEGLHSFAVGDDGA